jgi:hypothetical protein
LSDDFTTANEPSPIPEASPIPQADINRSFEPMGDPFAAPESEPETFSDDFEGLAKAARELTDRRSAEEVPTIDRVYRDQGGTGEQSDPQSFVSPERAARDLHLAREQEAAVLADAKNAAVRQAHDELLGQVRQPVTGETGAEQAAQQPELQPQAEQAEAGESEVSRVLREHPALLTEIENLVHGVEQHKAQLQANFEQQRAEIERQAIERANHNTATVNALTNLLIPELQGAENDSVAKDRLERLRLSNGPRYAQVAQILEVARSGIANEQQIFANQQAQYQQQVQQYQAQQAQNFQKFAEAADSAFEASVKYESPETVKAVKEALPGIAARIHVPLNGED